MTDVEIYCAYWSAEKTEISVEQAIAMNRKRAAMSDQERLDELLR